MSLGGILRIGASAANAALVCRAYVVAEATICKDSQALHRLEQEVPRAFSPVRPGVFGNSNVIGHIQMHACTIARGGGLYQY